MDIEREIDSMHDKVMSGLPTDELSEMLYSDYYAEEADNIISDKTKIVVGEAFKRLDKQEQREIYRNITPSYLKNIDNVMGSCKYDYSDKNGYNPMYLSFYVKKEVCLQFKENFENKYIKMGGREL